MPRPDGATGDSLSNPRLPTRAAIATNMTDPKQISREDWVRMAEKSVAGRALQPGLYHRRWEIETTFFELKVTQGMERGLRSRTPKGIEYEIAGHVILYFLVRWLMLEAALEAELDPLRVSFAGLWRTGGNKSVPANGDAPVGQNSIAATSNATCGISPSSTSPWPPFPKAKRHQS